MTKTDFISLYALTRSYWRQGNSARCSHCGQTYTGNHSWYRYLGERRYEGTVTEIGTFRVDLELAGGPLCPYCFVLEISRPDEFLQGHKP